MIDIVQEETYTLTELSDRIPGRPHRSTVNRWVRKGVISRITGEIVQMDHVQVGGRIEASLEAYHRFVRTLSGQLEPV